MQVFSTISCYYFFLTDEGFPYKLVWTNFPRNLLGQKINFLIYSYRSEETIIFVLVEKVLTTKKG